MEGSVVANWTDTGSYPQGEKIPISAGQGTTDWSWEIALDSPLEARQISTLGDWE